MLRRWTQGFIASHGVDDTTLPFRTHVTGVPPKRGSPTPRSIRRTRDGFAQARKSMQPRAKILIRANELTILLTRRT